MKMIELTPENSMLGTDHKHDYLKIASHAGFNLGIKTMMGIHPLGGVVMVAYRLRQAPIEKDSKLSAQENPGVFGEDLNWHKKGPDRNSMVGKTILGKVQDFETMDEVMEALKKTKIVEQTIEMFEGAPGKLVTAADLEEHLRAHTYGIMRVVLQRVKNLKPDENLPDVSEIMDQMGMPPATQEGPQGGNAEKG